MPQLVVPRKMRVQKFHDQLRPVFIVQRTTEDVGRVGFQDEFQTRYSTRPRFTIGQRVSQRPVNIPAEFIALRPIEFPGLRRRGRAVGHALQFTGIQNGLLSAGTPAVCWRAFSVRCNAAR